MTDHATSAGDHASAMDRMYRLTRHVYDATRKHYLLGRDAMIEGLAPPPGGTVLEMGCGTARNLIAVARRYPAARIAGFDISEEMLKSARASVARAGFGERIRLARGDATDFDPRPDFGVETFDRVYFSYTLSMVPEWQAALARACDLVAPGGSLHIVDFGAGERLPTAFRVLLWKWLAAFHVTPRLALPEALRTIAAARGWRLVEAHPARGYAQLHVLARPPHTEGH